ncbi:hypothetical protein GOBAR_DD29501 [Gossypium barbadense]|nr:hypothetical protein GOBAR_DD29501 [Gossypium barbadense]
MESIAETKKVVHVGVILDVNSPVGSVAKACIPMAISDFYAAHPNFRTRLSLHHRNYDDALAAAFTARFLIDVNQKALLLVVSFSATSPSLFTTQNPFFFDIRVSSRFSIYLNSRKLSILKTLKRVMAMQTRVIVVHMSSSLGSKVFLLAKKTTMISEGYAWIAISSMQGVLGIRPHISLENFKKKWKSEINSSSTKLNIFGYLAYDTVWALGKALRSSAFEIINVINNKKKVIGYWTLENGLIRKIGKAKKGKSMSKYELKPSIWPGNTKDIPRGWTTPVGGNKLRIGVPDKIGFEAYLKVEQDPYTKESTVTGNNMWIFLKPLSWDIWLTTGAAFVCTSLVVWILEHRVNNEFRSSAHQQVGTVFWFSFSILVFAQSK